jgi:hypothetical protein
MTLGECYIVDDIDPDILTFDIERFIFDIERENGIRYRIRYHSTISNDYVRYRRDETSISTVLFITLDIDGMSPSISSSVIFDIEHLRYRYTISNVKNVDIERAFDIECYARYRTSDTRYRGANLKDPDGHMPRPVYNCMTSLAYDGICQVIMIWIPDASCHGVLVHTEFYIRIHASKFHENSIFAFAGRNHLGQQTFW